MPKTVAILLLLILSQIISASESPFGVCAHLNRMSVAESEGELDGISRIGISYVRTDLDWKQVEPEDGKWDFSRWDQVVDAAEKRGLKMLPILCGEIPDFATPPFRHLDKWLRYVEQCVSRYKGRIDAYEVFNEADCDRPWGERPNGANYTELLRQTYQLIKKIDPQAKVLFTGVSDFGKPMEFVEAAFRAGAGDWFDVMNFHPYQWRVMPESQLILKINDLQSLMAKYNIDKPIWITEIGHSSAPDRYPIARQTIPAALKYLGFSEATTILVLADQDTFYYTNGLDDYLPDWRNRQETSFSKLDTIAIDDYPILALPGRENFPGSQLEHLVSYVRRGGTVLSPGGFPFYFDNQESATKGLFRTAQVNDLYAPQLHFSWEAFWTNKSAPKSTTSFIAGEKFPHLDIRHQAEFRFLTADNLHPGDELIPILYGVNADYKAPIAAIYRFDSDLKGNLIIVTSGRGIDSTTEKSQAELLPRQYLLALSAGVEKVFNYRFRAGEWNREREAHFGIVRRDFTDKPAAKAFATLVRFCPSTQPVLSWENDLYKACWTDSQGKEITALWTTHKTQTIPRPAGAKIFSLNGEELTGETMQVSSSIIYIQ